MSAQINSECSSSSVAVVQSSDSQTVHSTRRKIKIDRSFSLHYTPKTLEIKSEAPVKLEQESIVSSSNLDIADTELLNEADVSSSAELLETCEDSSQCGRSSGRWVFGSASTAVGSYSRTLLIADNSFKHLKSHWPNHAKVIPDTVMVDKLRVNQVPGILQEYCAEHALENKKVLVFVLTRFEEKLIYIESPLCKNKKFLPKKHVPLKEIRNNKSLEPRDFMDVIQRITEEALPSKIVFLPVLPFNLKKVRWHMISAHKKFTHHQIDPDRYEANAPLVSHSYASACAQLNRLLTEAYFKEGFDLSAWSIVSWADRVFPDERKYVPALLPLVINGRIPHTKVLHDTTSRLSELIERCGKHSFSLLVFLVDGDMTEISKIWPKDFPITTLFEEVPCESCPSECIKELSSKHKEENILFVWSSSVSYYLELKDFDKCDGHDKFNYPCIGSTSSKQAKVEQIISVIHQTKKLVENLPHCTVIFTPLYQANYQRLLQDLCSKHHSQFNHNLENDFTSDLCKKEDELMKSLVSDVNEKIFRENTSSVDVRFNVFTSHRNRQPVVMEFEGLKLTRTSLESLVDVMAEQLLSKVMHGRTNKTTLFEKRTQSLNQSTRKQQQGGCARGSRSRSPGQSSVFSMHVHSEEIYDLRSSLRRTNEVSDSQRRNCATRTSRGTELKTQLLDQIRKRSDIRGCEDPELQEWSQKSSVATRCSRRNFDHSRLSRVNNATTEHGACTYDQNIPLRDDFIDLNYHHDYDDRAGFEDSSRASRFNIVTELLRGEHGGQSLKRHRDTLLGDENFVRHDSSVASHSQPRTYRSRSPRVSRYPRISSDRSPYSPYRDSPIFDNRLSRTRDRSPAVQDRSANIPVRSYPVRGRLVENDGRHHPAYDSKRSRSPYDRNSSPFRSHLVRYPSYRDSSPFYDVVSPRSNHFPGRKHPRTSHNRLSFPQGSPDFRNHRTQSPVFTRSNSFRVQSPFRDRQLSNSVLSPLGNESCGFHFRLHSSDRASFTRFRSPNRNLSPISPPDLRNPSPGSLSHNRSRSPRYRSPYHRNRSTSPRQRSPYHRNRSSIPRYRSPYHRYRSTSPRQRSPHQRYRSTSPLQRSPFRRSQSTSPRQRSRFTRSRYPSLRHRSPFSLNRSPGPRHRSSSIKDRSPYQRHRSPFILNRSRSPRHRSSFSNDRSLSPRNKVLESTDKTPGKHRHHRDGSKNVNDSSNRQQKLLAALKTLWGIHERECDTYRREPTLHPDYKKWRQWYLEKRERSKAAAGTLVEEEIDKAWRSHMEMLFTRSWNEKKTSCLSVIEENERNLVKGESLDLLVPGKNEAVELREHQDGDTSVSIPQFSDLLDDVGSEISLETGARNHHKENSKSDPSRGVTGSASVNRNNGGLAGDSDELVRSTDPLEVVETLNMLNDMPDKFGQLSMPISVILRSAREARDKGQDPMDIFSQQEQDVLQLCHQKLTNLKKSDLSFVQKVIVDECLNRVQALLIQVQCNRDPMYGLQIEEVSKEIQGLSASQSIAKIKEIVTIHGRDFLKDGQILKIYMNAKQYSGCK
ncbi:uncharacterized protein LOC108675408 [Hyalella azteca]|uniref:Uncharacterized protein LOC108675408 n=1 Tax=Hyalella azteca TaxID=294128 RepID=A0A8B7NYL4_HYAAZ|nr:uncharacterized protein LOC108675408 [Hyalella azteca]